MTTHIFDGRKAVIYQNYFHHRHCKNIEINFNVQHDAGNESARRLFPTPS